MYRLQNRLCTMQCAILFDTRAEHKSHHKVSCIICIMYNVLNCIKYNENINLKLATGEQC